MIEEHIHEWHYNPTEMEVGGWFVLRFCAFCRKFEKLRLRDLKEVG